MTIQQALDSRIEKVKLPEWGPFDHLILPMTLNDQHIAVLVNIYENKNIVVFSLLTSENRYVRTN